MARTFISMQLVEAMGSLFEVLLAMKKFITVADIKAAWDKASPKDRDIIRDFVQAQGHIYSECKFFLYENKAVYSQKEYTGCGCTLIDPGIGAKELCDTLAIEPGKPIQRPPMPPVKVPPPPPPKWALKRPILIPPPQKTVVDDIEDEVPFSIEDEDAAICKAAWDKIPSQSIPPKPIPPPPPTKTKIKTIGGKKVAVRK